MEFWSGFWSGMKSDFEDFTTDGQTAMEWSGVRFLRKPAG